LAAWTVSGLLGLVSNSEGSGLTGALDGRVFAFTFGLAAVTGAVFGLVPAWQATSPRLAHILREQAGTVSGPAAHVRLRKALVVSQVAISLLMLIGAALFTRSLRNLNRVDLGFQREGIVTFMIQPALNGYTAE